jgi:membrane fusion protein
VSDALPSAGAPPAARPPLFRPQVAERTWELLASRGLMPSHPRFTTLAIAFLVIAFAGGGYLLHRGALPRLEPATGYLEPAGGIARVRASRQAIVGEVHVKDGELVRRGDILVTLQSSQTTVSGATAEAEIARQLEGQRADLEAQLRREHDWHVNEKRRLTATVEDLLTDLDLLDRNTDTQKEQARLALQQAERIRLLSERGTVSVDEFQRREIAALGMRLSVQTSEREYGSKRAQLTQARIALEQLPTLANERQRALRDALANVQQRLIELEAKRAVVVEAPTSGRIAAIPALAGSAVEAGGLIATIVPEGTTLHARVFVPTRSIGKVKPGQRVSLRYEAFPYQKYGTFKGRVEAVSRSVLLPQEVTKVAPVRLAEPAYLLDVSIERQSVSVGAGQEVALRPDMLLSANIRVEHRSLLAWIGENVLGVSQSQK